MKKNWVKLIVAAVLLASGSTSMANNPAVAVVNLTGHPTLGEDLARWFPAELREQLTERNLAIYAKTGSFENKRLCYAKVGITELAGPGRNVRHPSYSHFTANTMDEASWKASTCEATALGEALGTLSKQPMEVLFDKIELVRNAGGRRAAEKIDPKAVHVHQIGGIGDWDPIFDKLHARSMGALFDYRAVQTFITVDMAKLPDGRLFCLSRVGLAGRSNTGRNPRMPAHIQQQGIINDHGNMQDCRAYAAREAMDMFLEWTDEEFLEDFSLAREDGVAQPVLSKVKEARNRLAKRAATKPKQTVAREVGTKTVSCNNQCRNGDCVRTFADGRKERWTAPRVFDPFTQNWKWDTTTNACGI